jgi:hypothetical protein
MKRRYWFAVGIAAVLLVGAGGVGTVAADKQSACTGDKALISSEGADVGGDTTGSKYFVKPVCSGEKGQPDWQPHEPDDTLSVPESEEQGEHETGRDASDNFADSSD